MIKKAAVLAILTLAAVSQGWAYDHRESVERVIPVEGRDAIRVSNLNGLIKIRPGDETTVRVEAVKIVKADDMDEAEELAAEARVRVVEDPDDIEIEVEIPSDYRQGSGLGGLLGFSTRKRIVVELYIEIPSRMAVYLASTSGDIDVEDLEGGGELSSASGDIWLRDCSGRFHVGVASGDVEIDGLEGDLRLSAASGQLNVKDVRGSIEASVASGDFMGSMITGSFKLEGASGDVTVEDCGGRVDVRTASGDIWLRDVVSELTVSTSSGDVSAFTVLSTDVDIEISCSSGDIELRMEEGSSFRLELASVSGSIHCKLPMAVEKVSRHELRGVVGSGDGSVDLVTSSGDIRVYEG